MVSLTRGQIPLVTVWLVGEQTERIAPGYVWPASLSVVVHTLATLMFVRAVKLWQLGLTVLLLSLTPIFTTRIGLLIH